jgi:prepilin-type N-terminal cleavage/methylation domain-containing protein
MTHRARAFTLVEMLVALAITSLLVILLVNVVSAALAVWEQGRNQIDTFANARQVLGRIADEIIGTIAAPSPNQVEFSENLPALGSFQSGTSENIFFVAPYPNTGAGDLCVIAYRHNSATHELQRAFLNSQNAWSIGSPRYQGGGYNFQDPNNKWPDGSVQWRTLAAGVLEFEIQSYSQQDLDAASPTPTPAQWNSISGSSSMVGNTPRQVVIRIKVVDDRTLVKLTGLIPGNATYDRLVNRAARQFTASVLLPPPH